MRKITKLASEAFWNGDYFKLDNTTVKDGMMLLYGNMIAYIEGDILTISSRGYETNTTKERLNGVLDKLGFKVYQKKGKWYILDMSKDKSFDFVDGMKLRCK